VRSIKTVIRENGLEIYRCLIPGAPWICLGDIAGIPSYYSGKSIRESVNHWLDASDFYDPQPISARSSRKENP